MPAESTRLHVTFICNHNNMFMYQLTVNLYLRTFMMLGVLDQVMAVVTLRCIKALTHLGVNSLVVILLMAIAVFYVMSVSLTSDPRLTTSSHWFIQLIDIKNQQPLPSTTMTQLIVSYIYMLHHVSISTSAHPVLRSR